MKILAHIAFVIVGAAALAIAAAVVGNHLPAPDRDYVPMLANNDFMRDEMMRRHALVGSHAFCVAFVGDSRVAFSIETRAIEKKLGCSVANAGFPGVRLPTAVDVLSDHASAKIDTIVLSLNEVAIRSVRNDLLRFDIGRRLEAEVRQWLLGPGWLRSAYLGHHRLWRFLRRTFDMTRPPDSDWRWSAEKGRWIYPGLDARVLTTLPSHGREAGAIARLYYAPPFSNRGQQEIRDAARRLSGMAHRFVILLPPADAMLVEEVNRAFPGERDRFIQAANRIAAEFNAELVDCTKPSDCGLTESAFADPVHLNANGASAFTELLFDRLRLNGVNRRP